MVQTLRDHGFQASQAAASSDITVQCDVVVIGSGSGGGVVAGRLAQAGHKVLVLEKGRYLARSDLPLTELPSLDAMYEKGGLFSTIDGGVALLAGSTVGGGSAVNWAASFKTAPHVTREWSQELGLTKYGGAEYEAAMAAVCARGGVQTEHVVHNLQNEVLRRGCAALGYDCGVVPRNVEGTHECGWCHMGCANGGKKVNARTLVLYSGSGVPCSIGRSVGKVIGRLGVIKSSVASCVGVWGLACSSCNCRCSRERAIRQQLRR